MSWVKAIRIAAKGTKTVHADAPSSRLPLPVSLPKPSRPRITATAVDWDKLVVIDFETYWDGDYTLSKLSTSEYIRDPRFKAQMMGIKIGNQPTKCIKTEEVQSVLDSVDWATHTLLCHNTAFDGFILGHHFDTYPHFVFDTLSMARGLHSNDIGAGLDEVAQFYKSGAKIAGGLEPTKGVVDWDDGLFKQTAVYCAQDVELTLSIFKLMLPKMPADEVDLIDHTIRMFTQPVLRIDIPRVEIELQRELDERQDIMDRVFAIGHDVKTLGLTKTELALPEPELRNRVVKKVIGSNEYFASLLYKCGLNDATIPRKLSPTWLKKRLSGQVPAGSTPTYIYAFSRDDLDFTNLPNREHLWTQDLDLDNPGGILRMKFRAALLDLLIEARLSIKSTTNITRAERFLTAGADGQALPAGYSYFRAHTGRWGGNNKMNMQNLKRPEFDAAGTPIPGTGELRQSILAPEGHVLVVADSGQIEARVNAWLWGQTDLLQSFRDSDTGTGADPYCVAASDFYGKTVTKKDKLERFLGKVITLGLGFGMGPPKFQLTLAKGALGGPPIDFTLDQCQKAVYGYRGRNVMIVNGWAICNMIIEDMANGQCGEFGPLTWEKEKIWLPNGMCLQYPDLKGEPGERGIDWTYRAGKGRTKIYGGLLCLGAATEVLTDNGWKPLVTVAINDKLWSGTEWVSHSGLAYQGQKETIDFGGVSMTPDHEILVNECWLPAEDTTHHEATSSFTRYYGTPEWNADGSRASGERRTQDALGGRVQVRQHVYDLLNAGPDRRFTVRGNDGQPFLVHNCENLVQALARIIVGEQLLVIGKKMRVVMITHDEIVTCVREENGPLAFSLMESAMRTAPAWCPDIPLNAEGGYAVNYSK